MKIYLTLLIIVICTSSYAQIWIAGDTSNFVVNNLEQTFAPESKITFDIDCDGIEDLISIPPAPLILTLHGKAVISYGRRRSGV
jgi:uncharacterized protein (UPF0218 family)